MNLTLERPLERERCSSCDAKLWRRPVSIGDEVACKGCLRYILQNSLEAETSFPPRWAGKRLDPRDFRHVVSSEFLDEYEEKEKEWGCPARLRLYCHHTTPPQVEPCGNFLRQSPEDRLCQRCDKCMTYTCGQCHMNLLSQDTRLTQTVIEHDCDPSLEIQAREQAFAGLVRGKDYQDCPTETCQRRIELAAACNRMTCPSCGAHFCYICGQQADNGTEHCECPSYGHPSDEASQAEEPNEPIAQEADTGAQDAGTCGCMRDESFGLQLECWLREQAILGPPGNLWGTAVRALHRPGPVDLVGELEVPERRYRYYIRRVRRWYNRALGREA